MTALLITTFVPSQVRRVTFACVCFLHKPPDETCKCAKHPQGCGTTVAPGSTVFIDASHCIFQEGIWLVSVRLLNKVGHRTCKIGYLKVLLNQIHLFGNRIGVINEVMVRVGDEIHTSHPYKGVTVSKITRKNTRKNAGEKSNSRTLELCECMHDVAFVQFLDGGMPGDEKISDVIDDSDVIVLDDNTSLSSDESASSSSSDSSSSSSSGPVRKKRRSEERRGEKADNDKRKGGKGGSAKRGSAKGAVAKKAGSKAKTGSKGKK